MTRRRWLTNSMQSLIATILTSTAGPLPVGVGELDQLFF